MTPDQRAAFKCGEFAGCDDRYCAYPGEEDCHWLNMPVPGCECEDCAGKAWKKYKQEATP